ncbi:MAG: ABC transporter substrate-binding protein [Chloroflexi bacterium]|nr:ABC transporter substrate-binding protein [Chloroflexota bacterium]
MSLRLALLLVLVAAGSLALSCLGKSAPSTPDVNSGRLPAQEETTAPTTQATPSVATVSPVPGEHRTKYGGILVLANRGDPAAGFDPLRTSSIALHHVGGALFGPGNLVMRCRENTYLVCPYLATSWLANPGFTEWTFTIRNGVYWHDGTLFTAEDAKFWFDLAYFGAKVGDKTRAPAYFKGEFGDVEKVEVLEHNRLRITFRHRNPYFLDILADPRFKIAHPRHLMQARIEKGEVSISPLDVGLVGLGPFKLEAYEKGSVVRVRRSFQYWEKDGESNRLPYVDGIDYVIMPDPFAMDVAFRTGRLDGGARGQEHYLTAERKQGYVRDLGEDVFFAEMEGGNFRLGFNVLKPGPWQDPQVRRAMALWIDKRAAIPSALGGFGWTSPDLVPPNIPLPEIRTYFINWPKFDLGPLEEKRAEARRLMAGAGYADGFSMGHLCRALNPAPCEFLKAQLAGLGIDLQLHVLDEGAWSRARGTLDYDSQQGRLTPSPIPEGTESVYGRYGKNPDAYAKHEDPRVDELYRRLREALTFASRVEIWRQIERYLFVEQTYIIPIAESIQVVPYRAYVKGLVIPVEDGHTHTDFATVWLDKKKGGR